ncbi:hypothetical protein MTO96_017307 [Rhipicephalus appendiculatus]
MPATTNHYCTGSVSAYAVTLPTLCLLVNIADVVKGSSGPRWLSEPPARLLFSNWTGATVRCSAEGEPRP